MIVCECVTSLSAKWKPNYHDCFCGSHTIDNGAAPQGVWHRFFENNHAGSPLFTPLPVIHTSSWPRPLLPENGTPFRNFTPRGAGTHRSPSVGVDVRRRHCHVVRCRLPFPRHCRRRTELTHRPDVPRRPRSNRGPRSTTRRSTSVAAHRTSQPSTSRLVK